MKTKEDLQLLSLQASIENLDKGYQAFFNYIKNLKGKRKVDLPQCKKKQ